MRQIRLEKIDKRKIPVLKDAGDLVEYINAIYAQFGWNYEKIINLSKNDKEWFTKFYWSDETQIKFVSALTSKQKGYNKRRVGRQLPWVLLGFGPTSVKK